LAHLVAFARRLPLLLVVAALFVALPSCSRKAPPSNPLVDTFQALTYDDGKGHVLPYRLFVPADYDASKSYRLVLYLHGAGERGTDNRAQLAGQPAPLVFVEPANQKKWPLIMIAPQCPPDQQWVGLRWNDTTGAGKLPAAPTWPMAAALALVDVVRAKYPAIDPTHEYVTGISMGGYGTWEALYREPKRFRRAVPIAGGYDPKTVENAASDGARWFDVPIWAFHSADDEVVPVGRTLEMVQILKTKAGKPEPLLTEYGTGGLRAYGHPSWVPAYAEPKLLPWMFDAE
jgi:predicted peptidase